MIEKEEGIRPSFFFRSRRTLLAFFCIVLHVCVHAHNYSSSPSHALHICIHVCICTYLDATVCVLVFHMLVCNRVCACVSFLRARLTALRASWFFLSVFCVCVSLSLSAHHLASRTETQRQTQTPETHTIDVLRTKVECERTCLPTCVSSAEDGASTSFACPPPRSFSFIVHGGVGVSRAPLCPCVCVYVCVCEGGYALPSTSPCSHFAFLFRVLQSPFRAIPFPPSSSFAAAHFGLPHLFPWASLSHSTIFSLHLPGSHCCLPPSP